MGTVRTVRTDAFRQDAVRIALTSGLSRRQDAEDLGVGLSRLSKWIVTYRESEVDLDTDRSLALENNRHLREYRILREEREILKKSHPVLCESKAVRFRFVEEHRGHFSVTRLCALMNVSTSSGRIVHTRPVTGNARMRLFWPISRSIRV